MPDLELCNVVWRNGEPVCKVHGQKLLDRSTYEERFGRLDQPSVGEVLVCPVSKQMMSFTTAAHDAIRESGTRLPD